MNASLLGRLRWRNVKISTKLFVIFGAQLLLIAAFALTAISTFDNVRRQREILRAALRLESLADNMQFEFVEAREIQAYLLLGWEDLGYSEAVSQALPAHAYEIEEVHKTADEIEALLESAAFQSTKRARRDTETLVSVADFYETRFLETVDLLGQLADEESGALSVLEQRAAQLQASAISSADAQVVESVFSLHSHEELFLLTGDKSHLSAAREEAAALAEQLASGEVSGGPAIKSALDAYLAQLEIVDRLEQDFDAKADSLDALIEEAEPIWLGLADLGSQEADLAQERTARAIRVANVILRGGMVVSVGLGTFITFLLWRDFDLSLTQLIGATQRLESGDLSARAEVVGSDEFAQLADVFNAMAARLGGVVSGLEAQTIERARDLEIIAEISRAITSLRDPETLLREVVELVRDRFGFYHAQVFLVDEEGEYAVLRESTGEAGRRLLDRGHRLAVGSESVIGQVTATGRPVVALDTETDPVHKRNELLPDTRSELALPLRVGGQVIGALDVQSVEPNAFSGDDVAVFQTMADQLAIAIHNAQLFKEANSALAEVEELNRRLTGQMWGRFVARRGPEAPRAFRVEGETVSPEAEILPPQVLDELRHSSLARLDGGDNDELSVAVPIRVRGEVIGAFGFGGEGVESLDEEDIALIEAVAERVGIALENARLFEQTQQQARREQLVNQITSKIVGSTNVNDILQITARELGKALRSPKTSVQLLGEQDDE